MGRNPEMKQLFRVRLAAALFSRGCRGEVRSIARGATKAA